MIPPLNFKAQNYCNIINRLHFDLTEPPVTRDISNEETETYLKTCKMFETKELPCHTQIVERCLNLVKEASALVFGYEKNLGLDLGGAL